MISRLQYISQELDGKYHVENIEEACQAGIDWVQLRVKDKDLEEIEEIAFAAQAICEKYGAKMIVNDYVEIAKAVRAQGVHLGQSDMDPLEARDILGSRPYIGATANTWEEVELLYDTKVVDYIGLTPYKTSMSREDTTPELGLRGYSNILNNMIIHDIDLPMIGVGGIEMSDIIDIQMSGCHGIAVASLINNSFDKKATVSEIKMHLPDGDFDMEKM